MSAESVTVELGSRAYPVRIGAGVFAEALAAAEQRLAQGARCVAVTSPAIAAARPEHLQALQQRMPVYVTTTDGEKAKSAAPLGEAHKSLLTQLEVLRNESWRMQETFMEERRLLVEESQSKLASQVCLSVRVCYRHTRRFRFLTLLIAAGEAAQGGDLGAAAAAGDARGPAVAAVGRLRRGAGQGQQPRRPLPPGDATSPD